jgi:hypothetical protein
VEPRTTLVYYRSAPRTLAAVSFKEKARTLWSLVLPAEPVNLIAADLDGDGTGELVVGCADGALAGLGRPLQVGTPLPAPKE